MSLIDKLKRYYEMKAKCYNCGNKFIIRIPQGIKVSEYLDTKGVCSNCKTDNIAVDVPEEEK